MVGGRSAAAGYAVPVSPSVRRLPSAAFAAAGMLHRQRTYYRATTGADVAMNLKRITLSLRAGIACLAAIVGAIVVWNASPAGAETVVAQAAPAASPAPSPTPTAAPHLLQVSGFADAGYTSASTASAVGTPGGSQITGRVFDTLNQQIQFHNFNLQAAYLGPIGGKVEASFGDDANVINSYPKGAVNPGTSVDLTQAYASLSAGPFTLIAGKFETLAGAEVIEAPNNFNFSRSILFGYAVPFTHTGARVTWAATPTLSIIGGVNRGWDTVRTNANNGQPLPDTNSLTGEAGLAWNPSKAFTVMVSGYDGQIEEASSLAAVPNPARPVRTLIDAVITYHVSPALTLVVNGDDGRQTNANIFDNSGTVVGYGTATWNGLAAYVNYVMSPAWSWTLRGETFGDIGGSRTGFDQHLVEGTLTLQYSPVSNVIVRGEVRGDKSSAAFFAGIAGARSVSNTGFGIETIVKFP